jgi:hypothetical protein
MDETYNKTVIRWSPTSLLKISTHGMGYKNELLSPKFHVMFDDNFDTVQPPDPNTKLNQTMDRLFRTNNYKYDDPFGACIGKRK